MVSLREGNTTLRSSCTTSLRYWTERFHQPVSTSNGPGLLGAFFLPLSTAFGLLRLGLPAGVLGSLGSRIACTFASCSSFFWDTFPAFICLQHFPADPTPGIPFRSSDFRIPEGGTNAWDCRCRELGIAHYQAHWRPSDYYHPSMANTAMAAYLVSLCSVCAWQNLQYFRNISFSGVVRLFLVVI